MTEAYKTLEQNNLCKVVEMNLTVSYTRKEMNLEVQASSSIENADSDVATRLHCIPSLCRWYTVIFARAFLPSIIRAPIP